MRFSLRRKKEDPTDYLSLTFKEKAKKVGMFCLKWGGIILLVEVAIWVLVDLLTEFWFSEVIGLYFYTGIPAVFLIVGGCMGGLSRYNVPPKLRIIEPEDQAVTPENFQIRIRYDANRVIKETIEIFVNEKTIPHKFAEENGVITIPKVFKSPPSKAVSLILSTTGKDSQDKAVKDKIRIICDPESDEEDYLDYWEFKKEDDTYWGKEMISAQKHAKRNLNAVKLIALALVLILAGLLFSIIYRMIIY